MLPGDEAGRWPSFSQPANLTSVMVGLVPTIHVFLDRGVFKTWMLATRASMTATRSAFPRTTVVIPGAPQARTRNPRLGAKSSVAGGLAQSWFPGSSAHAQPRNDKGFRSGTM